MNTDLLRVLRNYNPWLTNPNAFPDAASHRLACPYLQRKAQRTERWPVRGKAHLLVGARQVGKSTFLWQKFVDDMTAPLFINTEEHYIRNWCRSPINVLEDIKQLVGIQTPIFIDEAQHLDEAGLFIKGLVDGGLANPLFVTGSSSFHLLSHTRESLAGRSVRAVMHPFTLEEISADLKGQKPLFFADEVRGRALRHFIVGGYPEAWLSDKPEDILFDLIESFVIRDASDLFNVENIDAFRKCLKLLASQVGNLVNLSEWASLCGVSRNVISTYIEILEQCHIISILKPFAGGKRAEVTSRPKIYFRDTGIMCAVAAGFTPFEERIDRGHLFESWVASELIKKVFQLTPSEKLSYWRSKSGAEVDFVLEKDNRLIAFEVKAAAMRRPTLSRSARSFIEAYAPNSFYVVNSSLLKEEKIGKTTVQWVGPEFFAWDK